MEVNNTEAYVTNDGTSGWILGSVTLIMYECFNLHKFYKIHKMNTLQTNLRYPWLMFNVLLPFSGIYVT
jgi:hypothetical protein